MSENGPGTSIVRARGLRKYYGSGGGLVRAVDEVDLEVAPGEALAIMGPSGCGKSTLLHLLGGLDRPDSGEFWVAGRRIDRLSERGLARFRCRDVGFVFQAFHLMDDCPPRRTSSCLRSWPGARPSRRGGGPASCLSRSGSPNGQAISLRRCPAASVSASPSPGRSPTSRRSYWPTSRPATWTAPRR